MIGNRQRRAVPRSPIRLEVGLASIDLEQGRRKGARNETRKQDPKVRGGKELSTGCILFYGGQADSSRGRIEPGTTQSPDVSNPRKGYRPRDQCAAPPPWHGLSLSASQSRSSWASRHRLPFETGCDLRPRLLLASSRLWAGLHAEDTPAVLAGQIRFQCFAGSKGQERARGCRLASNYCLGMST